MHIPPNSIPAVASPSTIPRRSPNQLEITSADGNTVEAPSPTPSVTLPASSCPNVSARLAMTRPATTRAAPTPITHRASILSSTQPANGALIPSESESPLEMRASCALLHPKYLSSAGKKIGKVLYPEPQSKNSETKRLLAITHACRSRAVICPRLPNGPADDSADRPAFHGPALSRIVPLFSR